MQYLKLNRVLVVSGDPPTSFRDATYATTIFDLLSRIREACPQLRVYAALDQYRQSISDEMAYVERKIQAGFDGFFTQPFFSMHLLREWQDYLCGQTVFWGLSPVFSAGSRGYWERKNKVRFAGSFQPTLEWNGEFGRDFLACVAEGAGNCYVMPIRAPFEAYMRELFRCV